MNLRTLLFLIIAGLTLTHVASAETLADIDGDGIPDDYEINGIRDARGAMLVDLPAMGADPMHKDLFFQCDWMADETHSHKPKAEALKKVIAAFEAAPVQNPDGTTGIHVHIDAGPETVMNPVTRALWGPLSKGREVAHQDSIGTYNNNRYDWRPLDAIKSSTFPAARVTTFRYCLWAHQYAGSGSSGLSRGIVGDDSLVTLGTFDAQEGTVMEQAGTFMHEVGHNFGFRHGGAPDNTGFKPNHFSIMNYNYQFRGTYVNGRDGKLEYSHLAVPALDESELSKDNGVPGTPAGYGVRWLRKINGRRAYRASKVGAPIDWDSSGTTTGTLSLDVNGDEEITDLAATPDEWAVLSYRGINVGNFGTAKDFVAPPEFTDDYENLTEQDYEDQPTDFEVAAAMSADQKAPVDSTVTLTFTVRNEGDQDDDIALSPTSANGWADFTLLPAHVALASKQSRTFDVPVHIPAGASNGAVETVHVLATSTSNADMLDSAEATVTALNNATSPASGGTVSSTSTPTTQGPSDVGGGCFIATAAYGSYLDPHVQSLRVFRDSWLLTNSPGRLAVRAYYACSPPLADFIARRPLLRRLAVLALTPVVLTVERPLLVVLFIVAVAICYKRRKARLAVAG